MNDDDTIVEGINDPIVEEIHRYREAYAARFNYDLKAMFADIKEREEESKRNGWVFVPPPEKQNIAMQAGADEIAEGIER